MKRIWTFGVAILMLGIIFMVSGGSVLTHMLCDHCIVSVVEQPDHSECDCCHHQTSPADQCHCKYAAFAFESENTHLIKSDIQSSILDFLVAKESVLTYVQPSSSDASASVLTVPPPLLMCGGRHILAMNAILII